MYMCVLYMVQYVKAKKIKNLFSGMAVVVNTDGYNAEQHTLKVKHTASIVYLKNINDQHKQ